MRAPPSRRASPQPGTLVVYGPDSLLTEEFLNPAFNAFGRHFGARVANLQATVTFFDVQDAEFAVNSLKRSSIDLHAFLVNYGQEASRSYGSTPTTTSLGSSPRTSFDGSLPEDDAIERQICVLDLPIDMNSQELHNVFAKFYTVESARIMPDIKTGKSHGYGFVSFWDPADARKAIEQLHKSKIGGKVIRVCPAKPKQGVATTWSTSGPSHNKTHSLGLPPTAGVHSGPEQSYDTVYNASPVDNTTMYLAPLPKDVTEHTLRLVLAQWGGGSWGDMSEIRLAAPTLAADGKTFTRCAFVKFRDHALAAKAICGVRGQIYEGHRVKSGWAKEKPVLSSQNAAPRIDLRDVVLGNGAGLAKSLQARLQRQQVLYQQQQQQQLAQYLPTRTQVPQQLQPPSAYYQAFDAHLHTAQPQPQSTSVFCYTESNGLSNNTFPPLELTGLLPQATPRHVIPPPELQHLSSLSQQQPRAITVADNVASIWNNTTPTLQHQAFRLPRL